MKTEFYKQQIKRWPEAGQHVMAQYDSSSIYVYQAYRPAIADYAVQHQRFGGQFSFGRMSWIKPNFLWMMFRSGWATKLGQERILAVRLPRTFFDEILASAVASTFSVSGYGSETEWRERLSKSEVRLQWDPDHDPSGRAITRRAVQLGLRGEMLRRYAERETLSIEDITPFVAHQRSNAIGDFDKLEVPEEFPYAGTSRVVIG
ncbi:MAG: DUF4291 domain-containing protein [Bordetella sp.]|uniref:DUF4291 domain-containing protein n=1 Tax=Bordetella sp. TaxID=28081 RepID=UPI003F7B3D2B